MRFSILGNLAVRRTDGDAVPLARLKHRQLLALLLLRAGTPVSADDLTKALWDGSPPASAGQNLKTYVHTLRKLLSPGEPRSTPIETRGSGYLLAVRPDELDLLVFRDLVRRGRQATRTDDGEAACNHFENALDLWRGEALQDARGTLLLDEAANRLCEERLEVVEELSELQFGMGRHVEAVSRLRTEADAHPLRERLWERLMLGLHLSGDRNAALRAYQRLRKALVAETGLEPCEAIQELHQRILTSGSPAPDPSASGSTVPDPAGSSSPGGAVPPRQLPRDLTGFVGRTEELVRLRSLLAPSDGGRPHHVVAITGAPGSGKSALAVRAAHAVAGAFPDGQLYANLHGATPGIRRLDPLDVLGRFLRDLGTPPQAVPDDLDQAAAMWRSHLDGRRILVVLDDAANMAQIRPLLSVPEGNAILATSRENFALVDDCVRVRIGRMHRAEASAMFAKLVGAERAAVDGEATGRLIDLCGRLPLAVGVAGARLANRPGWTVADLVERLEDEGRRLRELEVGDVAVRSSLAVSYDLLSGGASLDRTAARALCLIGLLEVADVTPYVVAAMLDGPADLAERALERLVDAHLAECDEPGRYRLHDLVRLFARERAAIEQADEQAVALARVLDLYAATARHAAELSGYPRTPFPSIDPAVSPVPLTSDEQARIWWEREQVNLLSASSQGMSAADERVVRRGAALAIGIYWNLLYGGYGSHILSTSRRALEAAERLKDPHIAVNAYNHIGVAFSLKDDFRQALVHFERQLSIARETSDMHAQQRALGSIAKMHFELGDYETAIDYARAQQTLAKEIGYAGGEYYALTVIGEAHHRLGRLDEAMTILEQALDQVRGQGDTYYETAFLNHLGLVSLDMENPELAMTYLTDALALARKVKLVIAEPHLFLALARATRLLGEFDQAALYVVRSLETARAVENRDLERQALEEERAVLAAREATAVDLRPG
ncbi:BTAD domain-containing putative transcriptional regulator [Planobispora siamensis]|uniref:AfsR/SARP family transcriptional regulator n=1 Tax=Planobispora siamensis TaxID=936338 RepID=UPI00194FF27F|nr:BTAD domain-containing putative transcriptional regulator [Planobispora siamensis]